jgi:hypothetical protein
MCWHGRVSSATIDAATGCTARPVSRSVSRDRARPGMEGLYPALSGVLTFWWFGRLRARGEPVCSERAPKVIHSVEVVRRHGHFKIDKVG